jgi:FtsZ-binding cell division protein ZapB
VNDQQSVWTTAVPVAVTEKLKELETYDVVLQKIMQGSGLVEIRKYKEGQYGGKNKIKSEFIEWYSQHPNTLDNALTKEAVERQIALVPSKLALQKIETERKDEEKRRLRENRARNDAETAAMRKLEEERDAEIQRMVVQFPQFPLIGAYLRDTLSKEIDMKQNATISGLQAKVSDLSTAVDWSQKEITELKHLNAHLERENKRLLRDNEALMKKNKWSIPGFTTRNQQHHVDHLLLQLQQSYAAGAACAPAGV